MRSQFQLVLLLSVIVACAVTAQSPNANVKDDEKTPLKRAQDPRFNKMINLPAKGNSLDVGTKKATKSSVEKSSFDEPRECDFIKFNLYLI